MHNSTVHSPYTYGRQVGNVLQFQDTNADCMYAYQTTHIFFLKDYQRSKKDNSLSPKFNIFLSIRHSRPPNI
ncbi:hypothetical protein PAHAL_6G293700 [Panicum hallii]|uniref:Uncharacterized protein n=1 Tax=Panicum hallii TaxID=206008 RepID=A0A2T8II41_9POAL|nr:hypothetical protein PAHAL_6G293700 [Panicum hallii]